MLLIDALAFTAPPAAAVAAAVWVDEVFLEIVSEESSDEGKQEDPVSPDCLSEMFVEMLLISYLYITGD